MNKRHDRSEALKKGMELFHQKGFHNVGLAEICSTTEMQKGTFYNAFKSKEEFYIQSLVLFGDKQCDYIENALEPNNDKAFDQLQTFFFGNDRVWAKGQLCGLFYQQYDE